MPAPADDLTIRSDMRASFAQNDCTRRTFLRGASGAVLATGLLRHAAAAQAVLDSSGSRRLNLAPVATPSSRVLSSEHFISTIHDGATPANSLDRTHGYYALWRDSDPAHPEQWIEYTWPAEIRTDTVDVYWAIDAPRAPGMPGSAWSQVAAPQSYRILFWDGEQFQPVRRADGYGVGADRFNTTRFDVVQTTRMRVEVVAQNDHPAGVLEWRVLSAGPTPDLQPRVAAGPDRFLVSDGQTYLAGTSVWLREIPANRVRWSQLTGPGQVRFADAQSLVTTATVSTPGDYLLQLAAAGDGGSAQSTLAITAVAPPPVHRLDVVYTTRYAIDSPFWKARTRALIVNWIPHCITWCERTDIAQMRGDGGIDNFIEAGKANRGEPHAPHKGYVFSNAWVHQTVESMCIALMVDPQGDAGIEAAQQHMRETLARWIPIILAAQMPDGYLQTAYILADRKEWPERWSPDHRGNHEGYVSGYFIESAINHYTLTEGQDLRLYNGAKKLADCWVANIGPGKRPWFDGHQEMEQALVRFGRFVNDQEGNGRGDAYIALARFLLDSRRGGAEYDQSHLPPREQYQAVGHAVRATYFYSGMADIAAETGDRDYQSAVLSLWNDMVNRKLYLTGGIGSGETSEGFGPDDSLPNNAYCESCSSCGLIFFQYKLNLAYHDAKFADLYERTMYNALLGATDLDGTSYTYTNPLENTERAEWHTCPCCVGNIPRTLLMMPTWTYVRSPEAVYVNLFAASRIHVGSVAGTPVEMVQETDYPWQGAVKITVRPTEARRFTVYVRIPDRHVSALYRESPIVGGVRSLRVNGTSVTPEIERGYARVTREWHAGDTIELELPMEPQRVTGVPQLLADANEVALQRGPLVYNVEAADNTDIAQPLGAAQPIAEWQPGLLGGAMVLTGEWRDGSRMVAVPHYARMNRVGPPPVYPQDTANAPIVSKVWI